MVKVSPGTKLTLEEFLALPEGDVNYEFVDSQAVPKVSPKAGSSVLSVLIYLKIMAQVIAAQGFTALF